MLWRSETSPPEWRRVASCLYLATTQRQHERSGARRFPGGATRSQWLHAPARVEITNALCARLVVAEATVRSNNGFNGQPFAAKRFTALSDRHFIAVPQCFQAGGAGPR